MQPLRIRYQTFEFGSIDIHVRSLRDNQQFSDPFGEAEALGISSAQWPLFGVIWESSEVLALEMADFNIKGKRILEVGCGIALSSLLLNFRKADITATDYHPDVGGFLVENANLNHGPKIPFLRTNWKDLNDGLGKFDVVIGADLLYEREHVELLSEFVNRHVNQQCEIILVDPGRGHHAAFSKKMSTLGFAHGESSADNLAHFKNPLKGKILKYSRV